FLISLAKRTQQIVTPLQDQVVQVIHEFVTAQKNSSS
ncbi:LysR family transcriptional regulator, partial [Enterococcus faecium]